MSCSVPMVNSLCFALSVRTIAMKKGKTKALKLVAVPTGTYSAPAAQVIANLKDFRKKEILYNTALRDLLKLHGWDESVLAPLNTYLLGQLSAAKTNIEPFVAMLDNALKTGTNPTFTVSF
jgi:hypothetical protein